MKSVLINEKWVTFFKIKHTQCGYKGDTKEESIQRAKEALQELKTKKE
jgi:hypothetical protein